MNACGSCTLCCRLVPVAEIGVRAFAGCQHERGVPAAKPGCAIYPTRPRSCRAWSCYWLGEDWEPDLRPDRCGVVVDPILDVMRVSGGPDGEAPREIPAVQMWVAPGHELTFVDDPVRAVVLAIVDQDHGVLWRYRGPDGGTLCRGLFRHPQRGLCATAPASPDHEYSREPTERRLLRAAAMSQASGR